MPNTQLQSKTVQPKTQRIEARLNSEVKDTLLQAAHLRGLSLTDFIVQAALNQALETIQQHATLKLSADEQAQFLAALNHPPAPNTALKAAAERSRARFGDSSE
jgi:uncharacterized protein (DUF1778 family)